MARQIVKLFRGTKVADIPVEQPTKFELVINLKTAKAMGVTVSRGIIGARRQGDRVTGETMKRREFETAPPSIANRNNMRWKLVLLALNDATLFGR